MGADRTEMLMIITKICDNNNIMTYLERQIYITSHNLHAQNHFVR